MLRIEFIKVTEAGTFLDIIDYRTVMLQDELSNCIVYDEICIIIVFQDMRFLASIPELCDITFLVGETREPVCAVKAVLAARSRSEENIFLFYL